MGTPDALWRSSSSIRSPSLVVSLPPFARLTLHGMSHGTVAPELTAQTRESGRTVFRFQLCHCPGAWLWASHFTRLGLLSSVGRVELTPPHHAPTTPRPAHGPGKDPVSPGK